MNPMSSPRQRATCLANLPRQTRGMAVISALLVVAAAAVIAASMLERQTTQVRSLASDTARVQARALLVGGIDWARIILRADARRQSTTRGDQIWATPISDLRVSEDGADELAVFSGRVEDELGKFNLQNLAHQGEPDPQGAADLTRLMQSLGVDPRPVDAIAQRIAAAQARPAQAGAASGATGAAVAGHAEQDSAAAPAGAPVSATGGVPGSARAPGMRSLVELRAYGLDDPTIESLRPFLTILPVRTAINLNTVSAEVLAATLPDVSLAQAIALIDQRDRGQYFNNIADFENRLNTPDVVIAKHALAVSSAWFSVIGTVRTGAANVDMQALLRRDGQAIPVVIWMMESP